MAVLIVSDDPVHRRDRSLALTTEVVSGTVERLQVSDSKGVLAMLTTGARTVLMRGPTRTFREDKRPFVDEFDRTTSNGWGMSPGGGVWSNSNGVDANYSVSSGRGVINMTAANASRHTSVVNNLADTNARLSFSLSVAPVGNASSLALTLAYTSANDQYRARLSILTSGNVQLVLEKEVAGSVTTLGTATTVGTGYTLGDVWHIRAERAGSTIRCRAWKDGTTEPGTWLHSVTDTSLGAGRVGVRGIASSGSTAIPFSFYIHDLAVSGTWPNPPTITHDQWVRVLPEPYSGTWTPTLAQQITAWSDDTTPDVLAYATMYATGAPAVTSAALSGAQVMGQAQYGPLGADGVPEEGGDFHEYMGLDWTFPNGEYVPEADPKWIRKLDCSGFVRIVWGYGMGLPMVRYEDFDGLVLPRRTKDIGPHGPGVLVAESVGAAPSLAEMQIGDIPLFDADTSDPVAGQIDHNGIYLGIDTEGHPRFINSRKTPNGPTFGDLGGSSALDGAGLYATSLRMIRRF
ncbi:hypothetical protein [Streptomyces sp. NPDC005953]|uniref:hypothetical protein n=1 Tax=Streptomyces sp. NPDC005953 TaxID=3156719 RepID=UPI00340498BC